LVINPNYEGIENKIYKGVVIYICFNEDILEDFCIVELGNPKFLGIELFLHKG
jgi:hypothetical protein